MVAIDEAQFLDNGIVGVVNDIADRGVRVIVAGTELRATVGLKSGRRPTISAPRSGTFFPGPEDIGRLGAGRPLIPLDTSAPSIFIFSPCGTPTVRERSGVAQLVEQLAVNQRVTGSSPVAGVI